MRCLPALLIFAVLSTTVNAEKVTLFNHQALHKIDLSRQGSSPSKPLSDTAIAADIGDLLGIGQQVTLALISETHSGHYRALRYAVKYRGLAVLDMTPVILLDTNGRIVQSYGTVATDLDTTLGEVKRADSDQLQQIQANYLHKIQSATTTPRIIMRADSEEAIYVDPTGQPHYVLALEIFSDSRPLGADPKSQRILLDAHSGALLDAKDISRHNIVGGAGPGGNNHVGEFEYLAADAELSPPQTFLVERLQANATALCYFDAANVETRSAEHENATEGLSPTPFVYNCTESTQNNYKAINGASSPINDAHYRGQVTSRMFEAYLAQRPYAEQKIVQYVHYGKNFTNAFYDDGRVYFGDGGNLYYPLVSLNTVAHEIAHGFTAGFGTTHSKLMIEGQADAINESFSDIAGEAAEYFLTGDNDWLVGAETSRQEHPIRYMNTPTRDGKSVDHTDLYTESLDGHFGSGIFNKAFFSLATNTADPTGPWNTELAFFAFAKANHACWVADSEFVDAADCVMHQASAVALRLQEKSITKEDGSLWQEHTLANQIRKAFDLVGITIDVNNGIAAQFRAETAFLTTTTRNTTTFNGERLSQADIPAGWQFTWNFGDGSPQVHAFNSSHQYHTDGDYTVTLTVTSPEGSSDTLVQRVRARADYCKPSGQINNNTFMRTIVVNGQPVTLDRLDAYTDLTALPLAITAGKPLDYRVLFGPQFREEGQSRRVAAWLDTNNDGKFTRSERLAISADTWEIRANTSFVGTPGRHYRMRLTSGQNVNHQPPCGTLNDVDVVDLDLVWSNDVTANVDWTHQIRSNDVAFFVTSNDERASRFLWDFGDGNSSAQASPSHPYSASGTYVVSLRAQDEQDRTLYTIEKAIDFRTTTHPNVYMRVRGNTVTFTKSQSVYPLGSTFFWDFGDGTTSTEETPTHTYQEPGTYSVSLTVTNADTPNGASDVTSVSILASQSEPPTFDAQLLRIKDGQATVQFNFNLNRNPADKHAGQWEFIWQFDQGTQERYAQDTTTQTLTHTFATTGAHQADLTFRYQQRSGPTETDWRWHEERFTLPLELPDRSNDYCPASGDTTLESIRVVEINGQRFETDDIGGLINPNDPIILKATNNAYYIAANYNAGASPERYHLWVDLNRDYWFGGPELDVYSDEYRLNRLDFLDTQLARGYIEGYFDLPISDTIAGSYYSRLRILQQFELYLSSDLTPCTDYSRDGYDSGEVEDYLVRWLIPAQPQITPQINTSQVRFENTTAALDNVRWQWTFGDGAVSEQKSPSHTYQAPGSYQPQLAMYSSEGELLGQWQAEVTIDAEPNTTTTASLIVRTEHNQLHYDASQSQFPEDSVIEIDFGDATKAHALAGDHTYQTAGSYTVTLTITNASHPEGISHSQTVAITLEETRQKKKGGGGTMGLCLLAVLVLLRCRRQRRPRNQVH